MASPKSRRGKKKSPKMPERIFAQASPLSIGGRSLFEQMTPVSSQDVGDYTSEDAITRNAVSELQAAGFEVLNVGDCSINIAGPPKLFEEVFETKLYTEERSVIKENATEDEATFIDSKDNDTPGYVGVGKSKLSNVLEGIAIEEPYYYMAPNAFAPPRSYWHLRVPADVSLALNADRAHRGNRTGRRVNLVMCDSGWYRHPYFTQRGYRAAPVVLGPGASSPNTDESGHGTGESANAFAAAPDINFTMVKMNFVNTTGAFNVAVALGPDIISNSWGSSKRFGPLSAAQQTMAAAISAAVARGIIVVFSAGNGHWGFPGQHPDVISAGGVYMEEDGSMQASSYSSGFASNIYAGRNVPDVSGLVGMRAPVSGNPGAMYIMLPLEPGDDIDVGNSNSGANHYRSPGATSPFGDETASDDGWAVFSGTSAAAPQIAGVCALIKQACPRLTPVEVKNILNRTARDVTVGTNAHGNTAATGYDLATGHGLVDAYRAVMVARLRCRLTIRPVRPVQPIGPIQPVQPVRPIQPIRPVQPVRPIQPIRPVGPVVARSRTLQEDDADMGSDLTEEDVAALEDMIRRGEIDEL